MTGVADALDRGYHAVAFDGPGQGAALIELGLHLRPDWEHVIGPGARSRGRARPAPIPAAIAVMGISHGGWLVARALALAAATPTEPTRPAAFVADPGIVRLIDGVLPQFDDDLVERFHQRDQQGFDDALAAQVAAPGAANDLRVTARTIGDPFGTTSAYDALLRLEAFDLGPLLAGRHRRPDVGVRSGCGRWMARAVARAGRRAPAGRTRCSARLGHPGGVHRGRGRRARLRDPGARAAQPAGLRLARWIPRASRR